MDISVSAGAIVSKSEEVLSQIDILSNQIKGIKTVANYILQDKVLGDSGFFLIGVTVFVLACFIGYYVIWNVTPALHSPLMAVTNAISSVIIIGALITLGSYESVLLSDIFAFMAIVLASINIFGGFSITQRMLHMFKKRK